MKSQISKKGLFLIALVCCFNSSIHAAFVQVDPALTSAIILQMNILKNIYSKREKTQNKIIAAEAAVTVALDQMHKVEDKVLGYMANVQGALKTFIR